MPGGFLGGLARERFDSRKGAKAQSRRRFGGRMNFEAAFIGKQV
jgi:hypothetical protein